MAARRKYRIRWIRVLVLLTAAYFIFLAVGQQFELYTIQRETYSLRGRIAELEQSNKALADEKTKLSSPPTWKKSPGMNSGWSSRGKFPIFLDTLLIRTL